MAKTRTLLALGIIVLFVLLAVFAGQIAPFDPFQGGQAGLKPPGSPGHLFGTNHIGQDILSQILYGARISLAVGVSAALSASWPGEPFSIASVSRMLSGPARTACTCTSARSRRR